MQEARLNQRLEDRCALVPIQIPEALRLCSRQSKSRHLTILAVDAAHHIGQLTRVR